MNPSIALLRLEALLFTAFLLSDGFGERFGINEVEVAAHPTQIPPSPGYGRLKCIVVASVDVLFKVDFAAGVREFDNSPRRLESAGRARRHARQSSGNLRDSTCLGQFAFQAY